MSLGARLRSWKRGEGEGRGRRGNRRSSRLELEDDAAGDLALLHGVVGAEGGSKHKLDEDECRETDLVKAGKSLRTYLHTTPPRAAISSASYASWRLPTYEPRMLMLLNTVKKIDACRPALPGRPTAISVPPGRR